MNGGVGRWRIDVDAARALRDRPEDALLAIRLGMAVSAMRAVYRLTLATGDSDEPGLRSDHFWSVFLAAGYLHELRVTLQPRFPAVRALAIAGGATDDQAREVAQVISGQSPLMQTVDRVRNQLVFHFDEAAVRDWMNAYRNGTVTWANGSGPARSNVFYVPSMQVIGASIAGPDDGNENARFADFVRELVRVTPLVTNFFELAIAGHLLQAGANVVHE